MYGFYMNIEGNMKKYMLLFVLGLALVATRPANAQKQPYNIIVVEEFTGTWCVDCPAATDTLAALLKDYPQIEVIGYHLQGASLQPPIQFLYNMDTWMRSGYYDTIRSVPTAFINGSTALKNSLAVRMQLRKAIEEAPFHTPTCPIYHNVDAQPHTDKEEIKRNLIAQLTAPVRWTQIVQNMHADGATRFIEVGPGKTLQGMIAKIAQGVEIMGAE